MRHRCNLDMPPRRTLHASSADAEQAFYEALEHADLEAMMETWSEDDEIVCIHPGGPRLVGHAAVRAAWRAMFANGPVRARPAHLHTLLGPMLAVHCVVEQIMSARAPGAPVVVNVFATNVFLKGPLGWRLILHHASLAPQDSVVAAAGSPKLLH